MNQLLAQRRSVRLKTLVSENVRTSTNCKNALDAQRSNPFDTAIPDRCQTGKKRLRLDCERHTGQWTQTQDFAVLRRKKGEVVVAVMMMATTRTNVVRKRDHVTSIVTFFFFLLASLSKRNRRILVKLIPSRFRLRNARKSLR
jgi:hypothetical protein